MASPTLGFSLADDDQRRVNRLAARYAHGNRSEWLRQAIDLFEEKALFDSLARLQARGDRRTAARGLDREALHELLAETLADRSEYRSAHVQELLDELGTDELEPGRESEVDAFLRATSEAPASNQ